MPSFDVVSELDFHEVTNALDQASREVGTRFDFKGSDAGYERTDDVITMTAASEYQLQQMLEILYNKLARRGIDLKAIEAGKAVETGRTWTQPVTLRHGLDAKLAKQVVQLVKDSKLKVTAAIQGAQVRITGKKRDDLQAAIAMLRAAKVDLPLQYENFRE